MDAAAHSPGYGPQSRQGGLAAEAEEQEGSSSWAEVRYRGLGSAETAKWRVQLLPPVCWAACWRKTL